MAANDYDLSQYSEEELNQMLQNGGYLPAKPVQTPDEAANRAAVANAPPLSKGLNDAAKFALGDTQDDTSNGMPGWRLALAGAGADIDSLLKGAKQKFQLAFAPPGEAGNKLRAGISADRANDAAVRERLFNNPAAQFGGFVGNAAEFAAAPARIPAQMAVSGALGLLAEPTTPATGIGSDMAGSALTGAEGAGAAYGVGKLGSVIGKGLGAMSGRFDNPDAIRLNDSAKDLGVDLRISDLDPGSTFGRIERNFPGAGGFVDKQAGQLRNALDTTKDVPSLSGNSTEERVLPGENLRQGYQDASDQLYNANKARWGSLDQYVVDNNLRPVLPQSTFQTFESVGKEMTPVKTDTTGQPVLDSNGDPQYLPLKNPVFSRIDRYDPQAAEWARAIAGSKPQWVSKGIPFSSLNDLRIAVGKAIGRAQVDASVPNAPDEAVQSLKALNGMYKGINQDLESWGTNNAGNAQAKQMFDDAVGFYRDRIVPDVINNPLVAKATRGPIGMNRRGFTTADDMFGAILNKPELTDRVKPYMLPAQQDLVDTFRTAADARNKMMGVRPPPDDTPGIMGLLKTAVGHPIDSIMSMMANLPGLHDVSASGPAKAYHFGTDVTQGQGALPRLMQAGSAYPRREAAGYEDSMLRPR